MRGGVGILHAATTSSGFKALSITASSGFEMASERKYADLVFTRHWMGQILGV